MTNDGEDGNGLQYRKNLKPRDSRFITLHVDLGNMENILTKLLLQRCKLIRGFCLGIFPMSVTGERPFKI